VASSLIRGLYGLSAVNTHSVASLAVASKQVTMCDDKDTLSYLYVAVSLFYCCYFSTASYLYLCRSAKEQTRHMSRDTSELLPSPIALILLGLIPCIYILERAFERGQCYISGMYYGISNCAPYCSKEQALDCLRIIVSISIFIILTGLIHYVGICMMTRSRTTAAVPLRRSSRVRKPRVLD
jgi:hypothetical protein